MRAYAKNAPNRMIAERPLEDGERFLIHTKEGAYYSEKAKTIGEAFELNPSALQIDRVRMVHDENGSRAENLGSTTNPELRRYLRQFKKK